ncbi:MAG: hypothetical protein IKH43_01335 [Bacteroidaceae bacterium]|nr:hypothetical protein [Bacteroidaceae bacterium]
MNRSFLFFLSAIITIVSCSNETSQFESLAKETLISSYPYLSEEGNKIENLDAVYSNDSLCILHLNVILNGSDRIEEEWHQGEYVLYSYNGKLYEAIHDLNDLNEERVFLSQEELNSEKKGKIYEDLDYPNALLYRSILLINTSGNEVGKKDVKVSLPTPTGTGLWKLNYLIDEFGDETTEKYISLNGKGEYSNNSSIEEKLDVILYVDTGMCSFKLFENGIYLVAYVN